MHLAGRRELVIGILVGALAAALTFTIPRLMFVAHNVALRRLQEAAFTLVSPGVILEFVCGWQFHSLPVWLAAAVNFLFWLGFAWLFGFLLGKLRQQFRLLVSHF